MALAWALVPAPGLAARAAPAPPEATAGSSEAVVPPEDQPIDEPIDERERGTPRDDRTPRVVAPAEPDEPAPAEAGRPLILAGASLAGVGVALALGGGIAFGAVARQRSEAVRAVQEDGNPDALSFAATQALADEGKRFEAIQIGIAAGGAVVAVTGAVLLALGLREREAVRAQAWLGPTTAGIAIGGRF